LRQGLFRYRRCAAFPEAAQSFAALAKPPVFSEFTADLQFCSVMYSTLKLGYELKQNR